MTFFPRAIAARINAEEVLLAPLFITPTAKPPDSFESTGAVSRTSTWAVPHGMAQEGILSRDGSLAATCAIYGASIDGNLRFTRVESGNGQGSQPSENRLVIMRRDRKSRHVAHRPMRFHQRPEGVLHVFFEFAHPPSVTRLTNQTRLKVPCRHSLSFAQTHPIAVQSKVRRISRGSVPSHWRGVTTWMPNGFSNVVKSLSRAMIVCACPASAASIMMSSLGSRRTGEGSASGEFQTPKSRTSVNHGDKSVSNPCWSFTRRNVRSYSS